MKKGEIVLSAVCLAFFLFMFSEAFQLRGEGRSGEVGSAFWPLLALGVTTILSLIWLINNLRRYFRETGETAPKTPAPEAVAIHRIGQRKVALCSICLLAYIVLIPLIGFILSTVLFILAFILALEEKRRLVLIISPLLITTVVMLIFAKFIMMSLPKGVGVFAEFSRLFY
ncbi:MAG: tripartite tricarboxylate transporter TctB family protein [Syntrophales bacterium]